MSLDLSTIDSFPTLSTERLLLREYEKNDAEDLLEIRTDPQVMRFMDREPFGSLNEAEKFVDLKIQDRLDHKGISWAVCDGATGQYMGDLSFWKILLRDHPQR